MLGLLTATRFDRRMTRGRTGPILLECDDAAGDSVEVVAKFTSAQLTVEGLVRESFSAMLAADLGLPVPACYCVKISPDDFLRGLRDHLGPAMREIMRTLA